MKYVVLAVLGLLALSACEKSPYKDLPASAGQAGGDGGGSGSGQ